MDWFLYDNSLRHERVKQPVPDAWSFSVLRKEKTRKIVEWHNVLKSTETE